MLAICIARDFTEPATDLPPTLADAIAKSPNLYSLEQRLDLAEQQRQIRAAKSLDRKFTALAALDVLLAILFACELWALYRSFI